LSPSSPNGPAVTSGEEPTCPLIDGIAISYGES